MVFTKALIVVLKLICLAHIGRLNLSVQRHSQVRQVMARDTICLREIQIILPLCLQSRLQQRLAADLTLVTLLARNGQQKRYDKGKVHRSQEGRETRRKARSSDVRAEMAKQAAMGKSQADVNLCAAQFNLLLP